MKVVFVCTGNTCRSPMAAQYFKKRLKDMGRADVKVSSCGLFVMPDSVTEPKAIEALKRLGINGRKQKARQLMTKDISDADYILTMTDGQCEKVKQLAACNIFSLGAFVGRVDIADPYGGTQDDYNYAAIQIAEAVDNFIKNQLITL